MVGPRSPAYSRAARRTCCRHLVAVAVTTAVHVIVPTFMHMMASIKWKLSREIIHTEYGALAVVTC